MPRSLLVSLALLTACTSASFAGLNAGTQNGALQSTAGNASPLGLARTPVLSALVEQISDTSSKPKIKKISRIVPSGSQQITITGINFGTNTPYFGDSPDLWMEDIGVGEKPFSPWRGGCAGPTPCGTTIQVTSWSDTQIAVAGFGGNYPNNPLHRGETLVWQVINPQTGAGPVGAVAYVR